MSWFSNLFTTNLSDTVKVVGEGVGSLMDRFGLSKPLSESERFDNQMKIFKLMLDSDKLKIEDVKSARDMYMIQMQTQKASWFIRFLNGSLRPIAGYMSLICVTDKWWGQILSKLIEGFSWAPIDANPTEEIILVSILGFFFGFRQRSKEKTVSTTS